MSEYDVNPPSEPTPPDESTGHVEPASPAEPSEPAEGSDDDDFEVSPFGLIAAGVYSPPVPTVVEPEPEPEPEAATHPAATVRTEPDAVAGPEARPGPEAVAEPEAGAGPDAVAGPEGLPAPDAAPAPEHDAGLEPESAVEPEAEPEAASQSPAEPDADPEPDPEPDPVTDPLLAPAKASALTVAATLAAVIAVAACAVLGVVVVKDSQRNAKRASYLAVDHARAGAIEAARRETAATLTYDYRTLRRDFAAAEKGLTPTFAKSYLHTATTQVTPLAAKTKAVSTATIAAAGVISASATSAQILVYADQTVQNNLLKATSRLDRSVIEVSMVKLHGVWLVNNLSPF